MRAYEEEATHLPRSDGFIIAGWGRCARIAGVANGQEGVDLIGDSQFPRKRR